MCWKIIESDFLVVKQSESILLNLVAKAINEDYALDLSIYEFINWQEVFHLAKRQGVVAIAMDALDFLPTQFRPDNDVLMQWIGQVCVMEDAYRRHRAVIHELADFYDGNGYMMMLLKGYGLSSFWPVPEHRPVGDIDIFLGLKDTEPAFGHSNVWRQADRTAKERLGIEVDNTRHHHSVFIYKGISVENHFDFINAYDHRTSRRLERVFKQLVSEGFERTNECRDLYLPSDDFNALFLLKHCSGHFASTEITLRQLLDWLLFVRARHDSIDWVRLYFHCHEYGLERLANIFSAIGVKYLGMQKEIFYGLEPDDRLVERVLNDILSPEFTDHEDGTLLSGLRVKPRRFWHNKWKHELCYRDSWLSGFIWTTYSKLLKPRHFKV